MKKPFLAQSKIRKNKRTFEVRSEPLIPSESTVELSKFSENVDGPIDTQLPAFYGTNSIFLIAQDPRWLFTYWDIDILRHPGGRTFLRCIQDTGSIESEIEVSFETRNWYIPVSQSGIRYFVELGYYRGDKWNNIAQSAIVQTPSNQLSCSESFDYATSTLSVSFQQLLRHFQSAIRSGENLVRALARLQKEGRLLQFTPADINCLSEDERIILEFLLGKDFLASCSSSNATQLQEKIQQQLEKYLSSLSASEVFSQFGNEENNLSPLLAAFSNNSLSSWNTEMLSSWTASTLSSWGASETSSWENAASEGDTEEFFMHVNAEVIFYGTTRPGSSVTIDSKPVKINPDGSFRCHFIFPDEAYEAPIISKSPDGHETHAAVLRFHRTSPKSSSPKTSPPDTTAPPPPLPGSFS